MRFQLFAAAAAFLTSALAFNAQRDALNNCLIAGNVPVVLISSPDWSRAAGQFNLRPKPMPNVVAIPRDVQQVQAALRCAAQTKARVSVKGGGHSYGAYGLSGMLVLNMEQFQSIDLNPHSNQATVGAGVRLGNMAKKIFDLGQRGLPHGTCAGVGIGGHATLGGFGLDSRLWGLTLDTVESFHVVTANGSEALTASQFSNTDLYWGLRGAGASNFAVVTQFVLKTFPAPPVNVNWAYSYTFSDPETQAKSLQIVMNWGASNAPKELGYGVLLFPGGVMNVRGVYYGARDAFQVTIRPLLDQLLPLHGNNTPVTTIQTLGWIDSLVALNDGPLETPVKGYNEHDTFYAKSLAVQEDKPFSLQALTSLTKYLKLTPTTSDWFLIINLYGGPNSAINSVPVDATAYVHRRSGYVWQLYASGGPEADTVGFVSGMVNALGPEVVGVTAYAPYTDTELADPQVKYWGDHVGRLKELKKKWDAGGVLYNPQGF